MKLKPLKRSGAKVGTKVRVIFDEKFRKTVRRTGTVVQVGPNWYAVEYRHPKNGLGYTKTRIAFNSEGRSTNYLELAICTKVL